MKASLATLALSLFVSGPAGATTTFLVTVPESTPEGDTVFVAGSFQGWNPGDPAYALTERPDGRWSIDLELADGQPVEFKFTRGSWERVEKGPNGEEIANRTITPQGDETYEFTVARWADASTITGHVESFSYAPFLAGRTVWVYLPPGYFESAERYPVLYMHDGQNVFDVRASFAGEWEVDEACEALISSGEIAPLIVVAIENGEANRCIEYTPWPNTDPNIPCAGGGADVYLTAVRDILMPEVNARYRTQTGPENTWMSGSSLGGLISTYAGYEYDDVWGRIAAVSPFYPWGDHMMFTYASGRPKPALQRFYQDMGTREFGFTDADENGIDDFIDDLRTMRDIALAQGFVEGEDFLSVEGEGHTHSEFFWALRFPDILRFLANPGPAVDVPRDGSFAAGLALRVAPNPIVSEARIELTSVRGGRARVEVIDLRGRLVRTLLDREVESGRLSLHWDALDAAGSRLTPGVYWVRAVANGEERARSVILLR